MSTTLAYFRRLLVSVCFVLTWLVGTPANAEIRRFALVVGNDVGAGTDVHLQHAQHDAEKVASVFSDLGGIDPADIVVLREQSADVMRRTLITVNDRVRAALAVPGTQVMLLVYYSGHADGSALRMGASRFDFRELGELVRGSAAQVRLLIIDACHSGTLTRVKGGRAARPFAIPNAKELPGEGMVFLTASSANEDSQESDAIQGSFFTHALVSGLRGAADKNHDGVVALDEAYGYAYSATLRATSETEAGTQHPTFQYDVKGQGAFVLTRLAASTSSHGQLALPAGLPFLVLSDSEHGAVVAEIGKADNARLLTMRAGKYFVRGRGADYLLQGEVELGAGETRAVVIDELSRVDYARLVRKGTSVLGLIQRIELGGAFRSRLPNASTACWGAALGYGIEFAEFGLHAQLGACASEANNATNEIATREFALLLGIARAWDVGPLTLSAGATAGASLATQHFTTAAPAPPRNTVVPVGALGVSVLAPLFDRYYAAVESRAEVHLMKYQATAYGQAGLRADPALRALLWVGAEL